MMPDEENSELNEPDQPQSDEDWKAQVEAEKAAAAEETPQETEPEPVEEEQSEEGVEEATEVVAEEVAGDGPGQPVQLGDQHPHVLHDLG